MRMHSTPNITPFRNQIRPQNAVVFDPLPDTAEPGDLPRYHAHGHAALANALDEGMMVDEVAQILNGRQLTDAFPVWRGESPADYAARAVAEMFVAYLQ